MLSILEYDEEWEKKKLQKGYSETEITNILEEDIATIHNICKIAEAYTPDYNAEQVWNAYQKSL